MSHSEAVGVAQVEYLHSNLSLPRGLMMLGGIAAHERYMEQTGADGMEVTPTNVSRFLGRAVARGAMIEKILQANVPPEGREYLFMENGWDIRKDWSDEDEAITRLIRSRHSSFRKDEGDDGIIARQFPKITDGFKQLNVLQNITGKTPLVVYAGIPDANIPNGVKRYNDMDTPASKRIHQPKPEEWRKLKLTEHSSANEIISVLEQGGIEGAAYDVFHALEFDDPIALAAKLAKAGYIDTIHLAVNRLDSAPRGSGRAKATQTAEWAFSRGATQARHTPEGEMVAVIAEEWRTNPLYDGRTTQVVLEEGPFGLHTLKSQAAMLATAREIIQR